MKRGFTLIELLVVISIIGIISTLSLFALKETNKSGRDNKRKAELEEVRSGLELYRSDCGSYPIGDVFASSSLKGTEDDSSSSCSDDNIYITKMPTDPQSSSGKAYIYYSPDTMKYEICAGLEQGGTTVVCGTSSNCGTNNTCNYKVVNP